MSGCIAGGNTMISMSDRDLDSVIAQARFLSSLDGGKGIASGVVLVEAVTEWEIRHPHHLPPSMADMVRTAPMTSKGTRKVWQWPSELE